MCATFKELKGIGVVVPVILHSFTTLAPTIVRWMLKNESELPLTWNVSSTDCSGLRNVACSQWFGRSIVFHSSLEGQSSTVFFLLEQNGTHLRSYLRAMLSLSVSVMREPEGSWWSGYSIHHFIPPLKGHQSDEQEMASKTPASQRQGGELSKQTAYFSIWECHWLRYQWQKKKKSCKL